MAYPGELVRTLADVLGIDRSTIAQQDRLLAESGVRRMGGRGRSALHVSPQDAASLLLAAAAPPVSGPVVRETVRTFRAYADLRAHFSLRFALKDWESSDEPTYELGEWSKLSIMQELPRGHSLLSALTSVLSAFMAGQFESTQRVWRDDPDPAPVSVRVTFGTSWIASSTIYICGPHDTHFPYQAELEYRVPEQKRPISPIHPDLTRTSTVSEITFRALADLLNNGRNSL